MRRRHRLLGDGPNAIDPRSGFKVKLADLVKEGQTGDLIYAPFADRKHPQDMVRGVPDNSVLPYSRPEVPDRFMAQTIMMEDGVTPILQENGLPFLTEGEVVSI